jgi:hypothetical protein
LQKIRLFGFSPEGGISLPVCVSDRNWSGLFERKGAKVQRRKESPKVDAFKKHPGTVPALWVKSTFGSI